MCIRDSFDGAASWFLPRLVGFAKASEWILKASFIPAEELQQAGFFSEICDPEEVLPRALELARDIAVNCSPTSTAKRKCAYVADGDPRGRRARAEDPSGFYGVDGLVRFNPDGTPDRGLAVYQIKNGRFVIIDPAPKTVLGPS